MFLQAATGLVSDSAPPEKDINERKNVSLPSALFSFIHHPNLAELDFPCYNNNKKFLEILNLLSE